MRAGCAAIERQKVVSLEDNLGGIVVSVDTPLVNDPQYSWGSG